MKALIHIGSGKTGSTSIQNALKKAAPTQEFSFPTILSGTNQNIDLFFKPKSALARATKAKIKDENLNYEKVVNNKLQFFKKNCDNNLIVSSEYLFDFSEINIKKLKKLLEEIGYTEFKVVLYLRDPFSYYKSLLQQQLKWSKQIPVISQSFCKWGSSISSWELIFNNIEIRKFSRESLVQGDVVKDFEFLCSSYFNLDFDFISNFSNDSLCVEALYYLRNYHDKNSCKSNASFSRDVASIIKASNSLTPKYSSINLTNKAKSLIYEHSNYLSDYLYGRGFQLFDSSNKVLNFSSVGAESRDYSLSDVVVPPNPDRYEKFVLELTRSISNARDIF